MNLSRVRTFIAAALLVASPAAFPKGSAQSEVRTDHVRARALVHAPQGVAVGRTVWVGLQFEHAPHWHTYWKNPGDSGLATTIKWQLPDGVTAGEIAWPVPKKIPIGDLANYGYEGTVLLPVPLTISTLR